MPISAANAKRYPKDWKEISVRIRFERAGGQCECEGECGKHVSGVRCEGRHGHINPKTKRRICLTTAHLDHVPENVDDANLRAFCNACHLAYDAEHHAKSRAKNKDANRIRKLEKAGQIAFEIECQTGKPVARKGK